ncbi:hypothetical protein [Legionella spiritensis]|uniref:hypothetical protein n=1 Tax=Legionella spiritensis TaxID=452 RepID=UPI000F6D7BB1|nr:hypothetical protein [Legionella spiritensis]VEG92209.1 Uncharacterised protein [Legionella spiritensis]
MANKILNNEQAYNEINNLLKLLEPELHDFKLLVKDMSLVNTPYKNEFNYIKVLANSEHGGLTQTDLEKKVTLIIKELNQFGVLLEKIIADDAASELYVKAGLLDKCINLQNNILNKFSP